MSEIESTDRPQVLGGRWATHILLARGDARGRRSAACWVLLLMSGVRIRLRINGSDGGSLLRAETSWSKADLVAAAKVKLLAESERALVDDAKVKLYLPSGWRRDRRPGREQCMCVPPATCTGQRCPLSLSYGS